MRRRRIPPSWSSSAAAVVVVVIAVTASLLLLLRSDPVILTAAASSHASACFAWCPGEDQTTTTTTTHHRPPRCRLGRTTQVGSLDLLRSSSGSSSSLVVVDYGRRRRGGRGECPRGGGGRSRPATTIALFSRSSSEEDHNRRGGGFFSVEEEDVVEEEEEEGVGLVAPSPSLTMTARRAAVASMNAARLDDDDDHDGERAIAILVLLTVPLAWGTYVPVVKYMYDIVDPPMPGFVFSAGYYAVAAITLRALSMMYYSSSMSSSSSERRMMNDDTLDRGNDGTDRYDGGVSGIEIDNDDHDDYDEDGTSSASTTARGGWELGGYLFVGNGLQVIGLQTVPADRAAFLVQLTTVMVPLLSAIFAGTLYAVPIRTWAACAIAFVGVVVMGMDDDDDSLGGAAEETIGRGGGGMMLKEGENIATAAGHHPSGDFSFDLDMFHASRGDVLMVLAALAYTMHVVRLGAYAPRTNPLKLAAAKASTEAALSVALCAWLAYVGSGNDMPPHISSSSGLPTFVSQMGSEVSEYVSTIAASYAEGGPEAIRHESSFGVSVGAILWTGWITCAYTIYAQSYGQRKVGPSDSNLIYTTQPLFSSLFAYLLLGETLGPYGYVGATLIGISLLLVSK